ncbi:MAG: propanediol utilization protein [Bacilli bacterium]|nr:propanediol utilization protein [Bacilli bacterium]
MKKVAVSIGISARHVHLCPESYKKLFDAELTVKNPLNQVGQFAANETVAIRTEKGEFASVRIIGPLRSYDQVELSMTDARKLGLKPPVRKSGNLDGAVEITIATDKGEITVPACIIADRHVHLNPEKAEELGIEDNQKLQLEIGGVKSGIIDLQAKVSDDGYFEVHLDTDDANAFLIDCGDTAKLIY